MSKCSRYIPGALVRCNECGHINEDRPTRIEFCTACGSADSGITRYIPEPGRRLIASFEGFIDPGLDDPAWQYGGRLSITVMDTKGGGFVKPVTVTVTARGE